MTTKRKRIARSPFTLGPLEAQQARHLLLGDCRSPSGCALCHVVEGQRILLPGLARTAWDAYRDDLLMQWAEPFPCFYSVWFDDAPIPDPDDDWPPETLERCVEISRNAAALMHYFATRGDDRAT